MDLEAPHNQISRGIILPDNVIRAYSESHRKYHDLYHIKYMVSVLQAQYSHLPTTITDYILWAVMYHDIVYNIPSESGLNEDLSAELFMTYHGDHSRAELIAAAIRHTKTHILPHDLPRGFGRQIAEHLIDLDLWALSDEDEYLQNNAKIKAENNATDEEWIVGRGNWLRGFLERDQIYYTDLGRTRENDARCILEADLASLS